MKINQELYMTKAIKVHGSKYDYSSLVYTGIKDKISFVCRTCGALNTLRADKHLEGRGCKTCTKQKLYKYTTDSYIVKCKEIYEELYDLSKIEYKGKRTPVIIGCPVHGEVKVNSLSFVNTKSGCPECRLGYTTIEFIKRAVSKHGNLYSYDKTVYKGHDEDVEIYCKKCKTYYLQRARTHLEGCGHPKCCNSKQYSSKEIELLKFLQKHVECIHKYKPSFLKGKEIDVYIPEFNLGIEYNGSYWHSVEFDSKFKTYHENKYLSCKENKVDLLFIWDFECFESWKKSIVEYIKDPRKFQVSFTNTLNEVSKYETYGKSTLLLKHHNEE